MEGGIEDGGQPDGQPEVEQPVTQDGHGRPGSGAGQGEGGGLEESWPEVGNVAERLMRRGYTGKAMDNRG